MDRGRNTGLSGDGSGLRLPYFLALKAEALHLADRPSEALEAIKEAEVIVERSEGRWWCAEMHRLRGVFLATLGADETQIEASFCAAIRIAKEQKSISLAETCGSNLRGIPSPKSERVRRAWIPTTSLVKPSSPLRPKTVSLWAKADKKSRMLRRQFRPNSVPSPSAPCSIVSIR